MPKMSQEGQGREEEVGPDQAPLPEHEPGSNLSIEHLHLVEADETGPVHVDRSEGLGQAAPAVNEVGHHGLHAHEGEAGAEEM